MTPKNRTNAIRRKFLCGGSALALLGAASAFRDANAQATNLPVPDPKAFQNGDLVWPKQPNAIVPYDSSMQNSRDALKKQWLKEREAFVAEVRANQGSSQELRQLATYLEGLMYEEFYLQYHADVRPNEIYKYGAIDDIFSVGHVGIVEITQTGERLVIEAVMGDANMVQRIPYDRWIKDRAGSWVWVGRVNNRSAEELERFVAQARSYVKKPYRFFNFDLSDESSFYCSKLVWLSLAKGIGVYLDNNKNAQRQIWYSPKQAWNSPHILRVNKPSNFTY